MHNRVDVVTPQSKTPLAERIRETERTRSIAYAIGWTGFLVFAPLLIGFVAMFAFGESPYALLALFSVVMYWPLGLAGAVVGLGGWFFCVRASTKLGRLQRQEAGIDESKVGPPYFD